MKCNKNHITWLTGVISNVKIHRIIWTASSNSDHCHGLLWHNVIIVIHSSHANLKLPSFWPWRLCWRKPCCPSVWKPSDLKSNIIHRQFVHFCYSANTVISLIVSLPPWGLPTGVFLEFCHVPSWCSLSYAKQAFHIPFVALAAYSHDWPSSSALYLFHVCLVFEHRWENCKGCSRWGFILV